MSVKSGIVNGLRKIYLVRLVNSYVKARPYKSRYRRLRRRYQRLWEKSRQGRTPEFSAGDPGGYAGGPDGDARATGPHRQAGAGERSMETLFLGTDPRQDFSGLIRGLEKYGNVTCFTREDGSYGQELGPADTPGVAVRNGERLAGIVEGMLNGRGLDILIGQMWGFSMDLGALQRVRELGIPVVNISMDDRHTFFIGQGEKGRRLGTAGLIGAIDLACTSARECCRWYLLEGCEAIFFPEASDPDMFRPMDVAKEIDVCFVGANYGTRSMIIRRIESEGIKVECYGAGWPNGMIPTEDVPALFARSRIVLGIGTIGWTHDMYGLKLRDFDGPMSGSLYVTHDNPDLYELFRVGEELVTFKNARECAEVIKYYLEHGEERERIARAGRERCLKEHTWEMRFRPVFERFGLLGGG